jgi:hypothetical protein
MSCMLTNMLNLSALSMPDQKQAHQTSVGQQVQKPIAVQFPYVSSRLDIELVAGDNLPPQKDISFQGIIFRRLSPDYFAWLRSQIIKAQDAHKAGRLSDGQWDNLKTKFRRIHSLGLEQFSEDNLKQAIQAFSPANYPPPLDVPEPTNDWLYPVERGCWKYSHSVTSQALTMVDAIKQEAMSVGWSEANLYQNRGQYKFPLGQGYGLVCHLDGERTIGTVTENSIEIISHGKNGQQTTMRFYNPDADQPWIKKPKPEEVTP